MADVKISALPAVTTCATTDIFALVQGGVTYQGTLAQMILAIPDADGSTRGLVTTGSQTIAGAKTFSSAPTLTGFTAGSVLFAGTGGLVSQSNADFFWDNANKRLGIGTATPGGSIDILGTSSAGGSIFARIKNITATGETTCNILNDQNDSSGLSAFGSTYTFTAWRRKAALISQSPTGTAIINFNQTAGADFSIWTQATPSTEKFRLIGSNGNVIIQNGGTFTDNGFRLDVNGTARVQSRLTVSQDTTVTTETCAVITTDTTNANLVIAPNGTGAIIADIPDGTAAGGNARGNNAVDLQTVRSDATNVASGPNSTIAGGRANSAIAYAAAVLGGEENTASGVASSVVCGYRNQATAAYSVVTNGEYSRAYLWGHRANASGAFTATAGVGDAQTSSITARRSITGTGIQELTLDGATPSATGCIILALPTGATNARAWRAQIDLVAIVATAGGGGLVQNECFMGTYLVGIKRVGANTSLVGTVNTVNEVSDTNMATAVTTITADDTNEALKIEFTPPTTADGTTVIRVVATAYLTEVGR